MQDTVPSGVHFHQPAPAICSSYHIPDILPVCSPSLSRALPQIKEFVDKHSKSFNKQLTIRYEQGVAPRLRMKGGGSGSELLRIDNWKAVSIVEYLTGKLQLAKVLDSSAESQAHA